MSDGASADPEAGVTLVGPSYPFRGGIAQYTTMLFNALAETRQVSLVGFTRQYPQLLFPGKTQLDESGMTFSVPSRRLIDPLNPLTWLRAFFAIRSLGAGTVVFQWWHPFFGPCYGTIALLLHLFTRQKLVFLCHNVVPHDGGPLHRPLTWYALAAAHTLIVHSEGDAGQARAVRSKANVLVRPHPPYGQFRVREMSQAEAREQLSVDGNVLLFFGHVRPYKGLRNLFLALPEVLKVLEVTVVVAGEFYEPKQEYDRLASELGIDRSVSMVDRYIPNEEVELYFAACDAVVCPYVSGTQSGVVQVAYSFNKPVISTRVGGLPEAVIDGETGLLAEPNDPSDLAKTIVTFFTSTDREGMARQVAAASESASWDALVEAITIA